MVTFEINSNEANALQIKETQVLQATMLQKNCQESKIPTSYITSYFIRNLMKRYKIFLIF